MTKNNVHWDKIYSIKNDKEVSWTEEVPEVSLELIFGLNLPKNTPIIDVGAGNSRLYFYLFLKEFTNVHILDISSVIIERIFNQNLEFSDKLTSHSCNILDFNTAQKFGVWHDRAVFHFLTAQKDIERYKQNVVNHLEPFGYFILANFSCNGPEKCSGLPVLRYSKNRIELTFGDEFDIVSSFTYTHRTPFESKQDFLYTLMRKKN